MAPTLARSNATRIAITSGKGGVGKTILAVNLAVALSRLGHQVGLVDADFALGNVDVCLGLAPTDHLGSVLSGARRVDEITIEGPAGIRVVPAGSGVRALTSFDQDTWPRLVDAMNDASRSVDFLILDTATGISDTVLGVVGLADYALVVTTFEPAAVVDAYAAIKLMSASAPSIPVGILVNAARDAEEAGVVYRQLATAAERFLKRTLRYDGYVLEDRALRESLLAQLPVVESEATSPASRCIRRLACRLAASRPHATSPWAVQPAGSIRASMAVGTEAPWA